MGQGDLSAGCKAMMHLNQALQDFVAPYFTGINLLVAVYLEQAPEAPRQIILDMDVSDDPIHGTQEQGFFNT